MQWIIKYTLNQPEHHFVSLSQKNHCIEALQVWSSMLKDLDNLPCAIENMKELRWLSYEIFPATSLSRNFQPTKLSYLQLQLSSLRQLWKGDKVILIVFVIIG